MAVLNPIKSALTAAGQWRWLQPLLNLPWLRAVLRRVPLLRLLVPDGWDRRHPYDAQHGTDTSGTVPLDQLAVSTAALEGAHLYGGSQPSIIRTLLRSLPGLESGAFRFIDLGCGKGRPLFVAAEFPFAEVIGVELSPVLARVAERNAERMRAANPALAPVTVVEGDATAYPFPSGPFVLFLYNPFGEALIAKVLAQVEAALKAEPRTIYVVYYNPVFGHCFDASPLLSRRFARTLPYAADELGYGPDQADPIVIWQPGDGRPLPGTEARIVITTPEMRSELVPA